MITSAFREDPTIAYRLANSGNRRILSELLSGHETRELTTTVPDDVDLCIIDTRSYPPLRDAIKSWKAHQAPTLAPVLLLTERWERDPWVTYRPDIGSLLDSIHELPTSKLGIQARIDALLETRSVSARLATEQRLTERIFETSPVAKTVLDPEGNIVRANARAEAVLGLTKSQIAGRTFDAPDWQIVDRDGAEIPSEDLPFSRVMSTGRPVHGYEHGVVSPTRGTIWLSISMAPMYDESGEIEFCVAAIDDITEQHHLQAELRQTTTHFRRLTEMSLVGVYSVEDERFTYVNPRMAEIFGTTPEAMVGSLVYDYVAETDRDLVQRNIARRVDGEADSVHYAFEGVHPEHELRVEVHGSRIETADGPLVIGTLLDVTERTVQERELRRLRQALDGAGPAVFITDANARIEYVNTAFEEITGYSAAEVLGRSPDLLTFDELQDRSFGRLVRGLQAGTPWEETVLARRKSGERYHATQSITSYEDETGETIGYIGVQTDVTVSEIHEQMLQVFQRIFRHNLRNQLNVVSGYAEFVAESTDDTALQSYASAILAAAAELQSLSDKAGAIEAAVGRSRTRDHVDLVALATDRCDRVETAHPEASVHVTDPGTPIHVHGAGLSVALDELLDNAIAHCDRDPAVDVTIEMAPDPGLARLVVADNGPGIADPGSLPVEMDGETQLNHASGIGLWLVKWIVTGLGGSIDFSDHEPRGLTVTLSLPLVDATNYR